MFQSYIHGSSQAQFVAETHIVLLFSILHGESALTLFIAVEKRKKRVVLRAILRTFMSQWTS